MDYSAVATYPLEAPGQSSVLPHDRSEWPEQALWAFRDVLRQLDRWCRQHDWPTSGNAWVAEEAVRQSW
jgi:hypothetical protein